MTTDDRLGGALARKPLHLIWILDISGSMGENGKIQALNFAVREALPQLREAAATNPGAQLLVRALAFARSVQWVVPQPTPIESFTWTDIGIEHRGVTELGLALREVAVQMQVLEAEGRGFAPAIVLVSDGKPTDTEEPSARRGLEELLATSWGNKAVKVAVGIGADADLKVLKDFMGHPELEPLRADNPEQLANQLRWVSTLAVRQASAPNRKVHVGPPPATLLTPPAPGPATGPGTGAMTGTGPAVTVVW
ncbi:MAG: vWA domain-containing protein [Sporichthyaceae bacterium]